MTARGMVVTALLSLSACQGNAAEPEKHMDTRISRSIETTLELSTERDGAIVAKVTFVNRSAAPYQMLKWLTFPDGEIDAKRFEVLVEGQPARYTGMMVKRPPAGPEDFGTLQPGHYVAALVRLSDAYALPQGKEISVTYDSLNPTAVEGGRADRLRSNTVSFRR